jgi:peptidoglycan/xylan/chitin deacetylase (PgdA/CDA1 family)
MTKTQVRQLASRPVSIGTHGHTHGFFDKMTDKELTEELSVSRQIVEGITGIPVDALSVPGGKFDGRLTGLALAAGYKRIFTSAPRDMEFDGIRYLGRYCINRRNLDRLPTIYYNPGFYRTLIVAEYEVKNILRTLLGEKSHYYPSSMRNHK